MSLRVRAPWEHARWGLSSKRGGAEAPPLPTRSPLQPASAGEARRRLAARLRGLAHAERLVPGGHVARAVSGRDRQAMTASLELLAVDRQREAPPCGALYPLAVELGDHALH